MLMSHMTDNNPPLLCFIETFKDLRNDNYNMRFEAPTYSIIIPLNKDEGRPFRYGLTKEKALSLVKFLNDFIEGRI